ncbi:GQ67_03300T0 [Komagataella phaffii]|nr:GQ67_03300T0 [Komagataella phaffii]AOA68425.1 GQ68_03269T0 [Komagataella phaffii GS115]
MYSAYRRIFSAETCSPLTPFGQIEIAVLVELYDNTLTMVDNSTIAFAVSLVAAFVFLRVFVRPPELIESRDAELKIKEAIESRKRTATTADSKRDVSEGMVEVVKTVVPQAKDADVREVLNKTRSVERAVELLLEQVREAKPEKSGMKEAEQKPEPVKLQNPGWADTKEERARNMELKRKQMIEQARKRCQSQG